MKKPKGRFVPTRQSLHIAETIASWSNKVFDPHAVIEHANEYHERMYRDLTASLDIPEDTIEFATGSFRVTTTFAVKSTGRDTIVFDEALDFWIWGMTHYACISTFFVLKENEWPFFLDHLEDMLALNADANLQETVREGFWHYLESYKSVIEFSHSLSNAILGFILCHEIAHVVLGHLTETPSRQMELDADALAADYFVTLVRKSRRDEQPPFVVSKAHEAAPLIAMQILDLHEFWNAGRQLANNQSGTHPDARERLSAIEGILLPALHEDALYFLDSLTKGILDIKDEMASRS